MDRKDRREWKSKFVDKTNTKAHNNGRGDERLNTLPGAESLVMPIDKFVKYSLDPIKCPDKAIAFERVLGYTKSNVGDLIDNILKNVLKFNAVEMPDLGFGRRYHVIIKITGANGKGANVLTAWIVDNKTGETRLTSAYVTNKKIKE